MKKVIIADAGDSFCSMMVDKFLKAGWKVFAGYIKREQLPEPKENLTVFGFEPQDHFYNMAAQKKVGEAVDMVIINIDGQFGDPNATITDDIDFNALRSAYEYNTLGPLYLLYSFIPLLEKGEGKRICVVTTKESSNNTTYDTANYYNHVSRAPLNMALTQLFNGLRPEGYTFRAYCKDIEGKNDNWAFDYFTRARSYEPEDLKHSDEERIVLRDWQGREVPW